MADLYAVLGVTVDAQQRAVDQAYRRLCRRYHPDVSREPDADARMREINAAYEVLGDCGRRRLYDQARAIVEPNAVAWAAARRVWRQTARPPTGAPEAGTSRAREARLRASPGAIDFGFITTGQVASRVVRVTTLSELPLHAHVLTRGDWLRVDRGLLEPGRDVVTVTADPTHLHAFWRGPGPEAARIDGWLEVVDGYGTLRIPAGAILRRDAAAPAWWNPFARRVS